MSKTTRPEGVNRDPHPGRRAFLRSAAAIAAGAGAGAGVRLFAPAVLSSGQVAFAASVPSDITEASATQQAALIRTRKITPLELAQAVIAKIKRVDAKITAVEHLAENEALKHAEIATKTIAEDKADFAKQRLFGVLFGVKDSLDVEGMPTKSGAPTLRDNIARRDATVVRRLRAEGGIPVVKTRLPFLAFAHESINLYGWARNPYDLNRTAGGSSGGAAAMSASGATPFDIGSDGGASIRNPAHCCGVAGLAPAYGRVSVKGTCPPLENSNDLCYLAIGPIARRVEDLPLVFDIISGVDPYDPFTWPMVSHDYKRVRIRDLRIGYWAEAEHTHPTPETVKMVEEGARALAARGAKVVKIPPPVDMQECADIWFSHGVKILTELFDKTVPEFGAEHDPLVQHCRKIPEIFMAEHSEAEIAALRKQLPALREKISASMAGFDTILSPVKASPALPHLTIADVVRKNLECHPYTHTYGLVFSLPSGTVRCSTSPENLPLGMHVVGRPAGEDRVLAVLAALEEDFGGWKRSDVLG